MPLKLRLNCPPEIAILDLIPPPGNPVRNRSIREIVLRKSPPLEKFGPEIRPAGSNHPPESSKPGTVHPEERSGRGSPVKKTPGPENRMPGTP